MEHVRPPTSAAAVPPPLGAASADRLGLRPAAGGPGRILWLDPDRVSVEASVQALRRHGYEVRRAASAREALARLAEAPADVIIMEVDLPEDDGLAACAALAEATSAPILVFSGKTDALDRVAGLEVGADDYLAKDAHHLELLARVRALIRRARRLASAAPLAQVWTLHAETGVLFGPAGGSARLKRSSLTLLLALMERPNARFSREDLRRILHGDEAVTDRSVDTRIARLRRELSECDGAGEFIRTLHGGGYMLQLDAVRTIRLEP